MNTNQPSTKRVDVIASLSMESMLRSLNLPFSGLRFSSEQVSMETQQMDEQKKLDLLAEHHANLRKLLKAEKPTGTPHLFVLDPDKLAVGDPDAAATLQAFANQQFSNSSQTAVAFIAPNDGFTVAGRTAANLIKEGIAKDLGIPTLESIEEVKLWLNDGVPLTASLESASLNDLSKVIAGHKVAHYPFTSDEIRHIEREMGQRLPSDLAKLYREIGSFRHNGLVILSPQSALNATAMLMRRNPRFPDSTFLLGTARFPTPDDVSDLIIDLRTGKAGQTNVQTETFLAAHGTCGKLSGDLMNILVELINYN